MQHKEFDDRNRNYITEFLEQSKGKDCDISGIVLATIAQFLRNFKIEINIRAKRLDQNWVSPEDIIDSQIVELRRCITDLNTYKHRLIKGVTIQ